MRIGGVRESGCVAPYCESRKAASLIPGEGISALTLSEKGKWIRHLGCRRAAKAAKIGTWQRMLPDPTKSATEGSLQRRSERGIGRRELGFARATLKIEKFEGKRDGTKLGVEERP
jgi:hypothetical protein